jgi:hypothetical protein
MTKNAQQNRKIGIEGLKKDVVLLKHAPGYASLEPTWRLGNETARIVETAEQAYVRRRSKLPKMLGIPGVVSDGIVLVHDAVLA